MGAQVGAFGIGAGAGANCPPALAYGSCVCIGEHNGVSVFVTAAHNFEGRPPLIETRIAGSWREAFNARICGEHDFATFEVDAIGVECVSRTNAIDLGTAAVAIGWGRRQYHEIAGALDNRFWHVKRSGNEIGNFRSSEPVIEGDSGGGVFNSAGVLIGVVVLSDSAGSAMFVPMRHCETLIARHYPGIECRPRIEPQPDPQPTPAGITPPSEIVIDYNRLADLVVERMRANPEPFRGAAGAAGADGANGSNGIDGRAAEIDIEAIAAAVVERMPPIRVSGFDGGAVQEIRPGDELKLPPLRFQIRDVSGTVAERSASLGGTIAIGFNENPENED